MAFEIVQSFTDYAALKDVEDAAGELYRELGYEPSTWPTTPVEAFADGAARGLLWVAKESAPGTRACGFALAQGYGELLHLDELDVHPDFQRMGVGRALVERVIAEARKRRCEAVTLRMFQRAWWSRALYESVGFVETREIPEYIAHYAKEEGSEGLPSGDFCTLILRLAK